MTDKQSYFCKCAHCDKELYDMINELPCDHLTLESTVRENQYIEQEHKRYCDFKCLQEWISETINLKG